MHFPPFLPPKAFQIGKMQKSTLWPYGPSKYNIKSRDLLKAFFPLSAPTPRTALHPVKKAHTPKGIPSVTTGFPRPRRRLEKAIWPNGLFASASRRGLTSLPLICLFIASKRDALFSIVFFNGIFNFCFKLFF